jgi:hypothetical protein
MHCFVAQLNTGNATKPSPPSQSAVQHYKDCLLLRLASIIRWMMHDDMALVREYAISQSEQACHSGDTPRKPGLFSGFTTGT